MKIKKMIAAILSVCIIGGAMPYMASSPDAPTLVSHAVTYVSEDGNYEYGIGKDSNKNEYALLYKYLGNEEIVKIPSYIGDYPVADLDGNVFYDNPNIKEIHFPSTVNHMFIGSSFGSPIRKCPALEKIEVDKNNTRYYSVDGVLYEGGTRAVVAYPPAKPDKSYSVTSSVYNYAFEDCLNLESLEFLALSYIYDGAFSGCTNLSEITMLEEYAAMHEQENLISKGAFEGTKWLENKRKEDPLVIVGNYLLDAKECSGKVVVPDNVKVIAGGAFTGADKVTDVVMSDNITGIARYAFQGANGLTKIEIPESVTKLEEGVYSDCLGLKDIKIPAHIKTVSSRCFQGCTNLKKVDFQDNELITSIADRAFSGCTSLETVVFPKNATGIGNRTFENCTSLKKLDLPDPLKAIGQFTFVGSGLVEVTFPEKLSSIGDDAFQDCASLEKVSLNDGLKKLGYNTFQNCTSLKEITIPDGVTVINGSTFKGCTALEKVHMSDNVTLISTSAFEGCTSLKEVNASKSLEKIYSAAFKDCTSLESFDLSNTKVTVFYSELFSNCASLKELIIPEIVTSIGSGTVGYCESLEKVVILNPEAKIGNKETSTAIFNRKNGDKFEFDGVIYGYTGSTAQTYAEINNYKFIPLDGEAPVVTKPAVTTTATAKPKTTTTTVKTTTTAKPKTTTTTVKTTATAKPKTTTTTAKTTATAKPKTTTTTAKTTATTPSTTAPTGTTEIVYGDANCDGKVTIADCTIILQSLGNPDMYKLSEQGKKNADCYNPGSGVTGMDALAIQRLDAMLVDKLPITE